MKLKTLILIIAIVIVAIIVLKSFLFVVDETQHAVILQFGRPVTLILGGETDEFTDEIKAKYEAKGINIDISGPGLKFKKPFVQQVVFLDDRLLDYDDEARKTPTLEKKYILIDNYSRWSIIDPIKFLEAAKTETGAQALLDAVIYPTQKQEVASNYLYEVLRSSNREILSADSQLGDIVIPDEIKKGREQIMQEVTRRSDDNMRESGIKVVDVRMKRADLPPDIKRNVESRMISERRRVERQLISEGDKYLIEVQGIIKEKVNAIVSEAQRQARAIEGQADAEAIKIYAEAYAQDPEFYSFVRTLESYKTTLKGKTKFVISTDSDYFSLMKTVESPETD